MSYKVKYLETVRSDRADIKTYLDQYSSVAARKLFAKIKQKMLLVKGNPYMYRTYERRPQFRVMVVDDYLVFYKVNEEHNIIEVHRVLHGMLDIEQQLPTS